MNDGMIRYIKNTAAELGKRRKYKAFQTLIDMLIAERKGGEIFNTPGCPYCTKAEVIAWDLCNDAVTIESDGKIHILAAGDWEADINYCPMCGRKL